MANSAKGAGNILGPMFLVAAAIMIALAVVFTMSGETPPDEPTIIADDSVEGAPAGAGTNPDGEMDQEVEGITDELEQVEPAAPGEESVPPATAEDPLAPIEDSDTPQAAPDSDSATAPASDQGAQPDEGSGDAMAGDGVTDASAEGIPAGRDAQTELNPDPDQTIVRDTDDGGTGFVPTPSGPEGRDDETIAD